MRSGGIWSCKKANIWRYICKNCSLILHSISGRMCLMDANATSFIAEDDPVLRDLYVRKFSNAEYQIHCRQRRGGDQHGGLAEPDLLLLDLNMPVPDGFGVMEKTADGQASVSHRLLSPILKIRRRATRPKSSAWTVILSKGHDDQIAGGDGGRDF